ncbi:putative lipopolysaccharide heptosyltransferase III [Hahella sp. SMD15-11]|uniref:Lipopolysaccharide heptosyltransferase III n=1 Tax=Thermohahella caldifontis TaxID=3142973 RepID=A0AB39UUW3_9GAMM
MENNDLLRLFNLSDAVPRDTIRRVLVIKLRHHGDVLLTSPVITSLAEQLPEAEIDALVYAETRDMLDGLPQLAQLHCIDRKWRKSGTRQHLMHEWHLIRQLQDRRYDLVIHLTEHWRGVILTRFIRPRFSVAGKYRRRQNSRLWKRTFTHLYPIVPRRHTVDLHLDALRRIGLHPANPPALSVDIPETARTRIRDLLRDSGLKDSDRYLVVHPTSRWMFKGWPPENFSRVIDTLSDRGWKVVVTAAPDKRELALAHAIFRSCRTSPVNLTGKLSLKELAAVIDGAAAFIGLDSVPMHLAAACQTPAVALFGPSSEQEWGPWQSPSTVLTTPLSCRPCGQDGCGGGKISDCLWQVTPERVIDAVSTLTDSSI